MKRSFGDTTSISASLSMASSRSDNAASSTAPSVDYSGESRPAHESSCCAGAFSCTGRHKRPNSGVLASDRWLTSGEQMAADEMKSLTLKEREAVYDDVHGVSNAVEETPELVEKGLQELEQHIHATRRKEAYEKAVFLSPRYVKDFGLRLRFLRSSKWNSRKAASTFLRYFQTKLALFGEDKLVRAIVFDDLQPDAQESLRRGAHITYQSVDVSGRIIVFDVYARWAYRSVKSHVQGLWYLSDATDCSFDEHRREVVIVAVTAGATAASFYECAGVAKWDVLSVLPMRCMAVHFCFEDQCVRPVFSVLLAAMPKEVRLRTKAHYGSVLEVMYQLASYGIRPNICPFDTDGRPRPDVVGRFIEQSRARDKKNLLQFEKDRPEGAIQRPNEIDVVLGRGWPYQSFPGNIRLAELVESQKRSHDKAKSRTEKTRLTDQVLRKFKSSGARFLRRDSTGDWWVEVPDSVAREKVAMTFRNRLRRR